MSSDTPTPDIDVEGIEVLLLGPLYGWLCTECGQVRTGHPSKDVAKSDAESHAIAKHAPAYPPGKTSMTLFVEWDEPEGEKNHESSG